MAIENENLLEYGYGKFQEGKYDEALEAFVLAYTRGYEREWILENVYSCYVAGNEQEFCDAYEKALAGNGIAYEECLLDFIPYQESRYYIFDKGSREFLGLFDVEKFENAEVDERLDGEQFGAAALEMDWNWSAERQILASAKEREIYAVCRDMARAASFLKIPELEKYAGNLKLFSDLRKLQEYFHSHTEIYLPKIFFGSLESQRALMKMAEEEHAYRLTPQGRSRENILLTIAIPTRSRGNLLLERIKNLCELWYDAEIEFAVSKNGVDFYEEEYRKAGQIQDARLCYTDHGKDLTIVENWRAVVEMSHGKYVLFVSDEDDVIPQALGHYLRILETRPELALVRAKTSQSYAFVQKSEDFSSGAEAFAGLFLKQNYLSGLIVKRETFLEAHLEELDRFGSKVFQYSYEHKWDENSGDNLFYFFYPHEWWSGILCFKGDCRRDAVCLILENESVLQEEKRRYQEEGIEEESGQLVGENSFYLSAYATYENRMQQAEGYLGYLHLIVEKHPEAAKMGLINAIAKTGHLLQIAYRYGYKKDEYGQVIENFRAFYRKAADEFVLTEQEKDEVLDWLSYCCNVIGEGVLEGK